jgi:hypothetical protein
MMTETTQEGAGQDWRRHGAAVRLDPDCAAHVPARALLAAVALPVGWHDGELLVLAQHGAAADAPLSEWFPGQRLRYRPAARDVVQDLIVAQRQREIAADMADSFTLSCPELAAKTGIRRWQQAAACSLLVALAVACAAGQAAFAVLAIGGVFAASVLFKVALAVASARPGRPRPRPRDLPDSELPRYTVLIPAWREEAVIGDTVRHIAALDYPEDKLEILVLVEQRDEATIRAVRAVQPPGHVRLVMLPPGAPQTKPRSCNLGLLLARGELLVIFDAEDRPEPDQLRKMAGHFAAGDDRLACVQARLNFYNRHRNWLTLMFGLEYAFWFDLMLVGLDRWRLPIPLGGTSNHIRTAVLREVGGWDAWNVTEDADLGLRFAARGYRVEVGDSTTWEECPAAPWAWIRQRSRWLKGYLLTLLVYTRDPAAARRRFGTAGVVSLAGVIAGTPLAFMLWPFALVLAVAVGLYGPGPGFLQRADSAALAAMGGAMLAMIIGVLVAARRRRMNWPLALLLPAYWLLHAFAGWRGLLQLIRDPYIWEKTVHNQPKD